jgi:hypothetical protein
MTTAKQTKYPTASFHRDGNLLHANRGGLFQLVGFGIPTGAIGTAVCYESVTVLDARGVRCTITADSYGGPFTVCVRRAPGEREWIGVADSEAVAEAALARLGC